MKTRANIVPLTLSLCAALAAWQPPLAAAQTADPAAATHPFGPSRLIPGRYIVVYRNSVGDAAAETAVHLRGSGGGKLHHVFGHALKGFAATLPEAAVQALRRHPNVAYIEQDQTVTLNEIPVPQSENLATWGLSRVDQVTRPLDSLYHYNYQAAGVNAFIIDTGIRADHSEFTGRLIAGYNVAPDSAGVVDSHNTSDCNGHGTHVAGTLGGTVYGVAKGVSLIPVRVLDCAGSGSYSGVIAGINWVASQPLRPAVANMSLGGGASSALNAAVAGAVKQGVTMVVAAGNSNANACNYSPSSAPSAITVGASDSNDVRASYSNYGPCLDLFAPGSSITSAWNSSASATNTLSGTSMASPHVAGVAALALAANPAASPAAVALFLSGNASMNQISASGSGSPNLLLYSLAAGAPTEPVTPIIAVKSITYSASKSSRNWRATTTVTIRDVNTGAHVANATVNGSFNPGGEQSCLTGSAGSCTLTSNRISLSATASVFTVTQVSGTNMPYDATQNAVTQVTINRP